MPDDDIYDTYKPYKGLTFRGPKEYAPRDPGFGSTRTRIPREVLVEIPQRRVSEDSFEEDEYPDRLRPEAPDGRGPPKLENLPPDMLTGFFQDKLELIRFRIEDIKAEVARRKDLDEEFMGEIEQEIGRFEVGLRDILPHYGRTSHQFIRKRIHLERSIALLKEQRRVHKSRLWTDTNWLKRELIQLLIEYKELLHLIELMEGNNHE